MSGGLCRFRPDCQPLWPIPVRYDLFRSRPESSLGTASCMPRNKLPNYLRACRKRAGLSQEDLAFLLGCKNGSKVGRYERFRRQPTLSTVFALERIFERPSRELFAGVYEEAERRVADRAGRLVVRLSKSSDSPQLRRKLAALKAIVEAYPERGDHASPRP